VVFRARYQKKKINFFEKHGYVLGLGGVLVLFFGTVFMTVETRPDNHHRSMLLFLRTPPRPPQTVTSITSCSRVYYLEFINDHRMDPWFFFLIMSIIKKKIGKFFPKKK
jgi:hypothetical protein